MVKNIDFNIFVFFRSFLYLLDHLFDHWFVQLFVCSCVCGRVVICSWSRLFVWIYVGEAVCSLCCFVFGRLFLCSPVHVVDCSFGLLVVCSCGRVVEWLFGHFVRLVFWSFLCVFVYSICLFLVFLEGHFPEAAYFYGISQDKKFTLSLLHLTEKEDKNARNENRKASMQRLGENIANLDPEVILLHTTEEKIQLLMTQTVC